MHTSNVGEITSIVSFVKNIFNRFIVIGTILYRLFYYYIQSPCFCQNFSDHLFKRIFDKVYYICVIGKIARTPDHVCNGLTSYWRYL